MGKVIKNALKKKRVLFPLILFFELAIITIIARVFSFETENSLYGLISAYIIFITFVVFIFMIIKDHKVKLVSTKIPYIDISVLWVFYFAMVLIIFILVIIAPLALMDLFGSV